MLSLRRSRPLSIGLCNPRCLLRAAAARIGAMLQAVRGRRALAQMDARMLADIGVSRAEADREINRRPWDTGPHRR